jgi:Uma2 family endonuclease
MSAAIPRGEEASIVTAILETKRKPQGIGEPAWDIARFYPLQGYWSEEDYFELEQKGVNRLIELNDGFLEFLPMPDMFHQDIVAFLFAALVDYLKEHRFGRAYFAPLPIRLWPGQIREPDLAVFASHRIKDKRKAPDGADLVMEILSSGAKDRKRDLKEKRAVYAKAKIPEYWIIDPKKRTITVLTLNKGAYVVHGEKKPGEQATSKLLKKFTVDVDEMFAAGEQK